MQAFIGSANPGADKEARSNTEAVGGSMSLPEQHEPHASQKRARKIELAVAAGIRRWPGRNAEPTAEPPTAAAQPVEHLDVVRPMPRRTPIHSADTSHVTLPMARRVVFKPGIIRPVVRLFVWFWAAIRFYSGNAVELLAASRLDPTPRRPIASSSRGHRRKLRQTRAAALFAGGSPAICVLRRVEQNA